MAKVVGTSLGRLEIGTLDAAEMGKALGVVARGMRDNPLHVAAFGEDPKRREKRLLCIPGTALDALGLHRHMLAARDGNGRIVGVAGMKPPGECWPNAFGRLRLLPRVLSNDPHAARRTARWLDAWAYHDPDGRHWHLGPVAVDAHLQGRGIGSKLMRVFCARMDAAGEAAYLETDKEINVRFCERFGFEVVGEQEVIGVPNWFMFRRAGVR